jgi:hypothetical protein
MEEKPCTQYDCPNSGHAEWIFYSLGSMVSKLRINIQQNIIENVRYSVRARNMYVPKQLDCLTYAPPKTVIQVAISEQKFVKILGAHKILSRKTVWELVCNKGGKPSAATADNNIRDFSLTLCFFQHSQKYCSLKTSSGKHESPLVSKRGSGTYLGIEITNEEKGQN